MNGPSDNLLLVLEHALRGSLGAIANGSNARVAGMLGALLDRGWISAFSVAKSPCCGTIDYDLHITPAGERARRAWLRRNGVKA